MKNNTLRVQGSAILLFLSFGFALTKASENHLNTEADYSYLYIDKQLIGLFKYRKSTQNQRKIALMEQGLANKISPLLKEKYNPHSFQKILGEVRPTSTDKHIFISLQWAYQKGSQERVKEEVVISPQEACESVYSVLSTWRNNTTEVSSKIKQMKNQLPGQLDSLLQIKKYIVKKDFIDELGYQPNDKDMAFVDVLQWAYQGASEDYLKSLDKPITYEYNGETSSEEDESTATTVLHKSYAPPQGSTTIAHTQASSSYYWLYVLCGVSICLIVGKAMYEKVTFNKDLPK